MKSIELIVGRERTATEIIKVEEALSAELNREISRFLEPFISNLISIVEKHKKMEKE